MNLQLIRWYAILVVWFVLPLGSFAIGYTHPSIITVVMTVAITAISITFGVDATKHIKELSDDKNQPTLPSASNHKEETER